MIRNKRRTILKILFFFYFLFLSSSIFAQSDSKKEYVEFLIETAFEKKLYQERKWHLLLHYTQFSDDYIESEQDAKAFFNAADGKHNPKSELKETLRSFFKPLEYKDPLAKVHPQCQFKARYEWLKAQIQFDSNKLKEHPCPLFNQWINALAPTSAVMVFPAGSIKYPSAMFGHTFLRLDRNNSSVLLNYSINYAANVDLLNTNPLSYAFKGIFGFYDGLFSVVPYYLKVNDYVDIESREIWEYKLKLTEEELYQMALHIWELHFSQFDYYFFDENCSYHLLSLLEVANPKYDLRKDYGLFTLPIDTLKHLKKLGLIENAVLRNSTINKLRTKLTLLSDQSYQFIEEHIESKKIEKKERWDKISTADKARIYEIQYDKLLVEKDTNTKDNLKEILIKRAQIDYITPKLDTIKYVEDPLLSHDNLRLKTAVGYDSKTNRFLEFEYRFTYHALDDLDIGYEPYAQIEIFKFNFKQYESLGLSLDQFTLLSLKSYKPSQFYYNFISWSFQVAAKQKEEECLSCYYFDLHGGIGKSYKLLGSNFSFLLLTQYQYSNNPDYLHDFLSGLRFVYHFGLSTNWQILLENDVLKSIFSDQYKNFFASSINYAYNRNHAYQITYENLDNRVIYALGLKMYF